MLILHRAEQTDTLARALVEVLGTPLSDPMRPEVVCVPARGVERWLAQQLSLRLGTGGSGRTDGIAANIDFCSPARLISDTVGAVLGPGHGAPVDPWRAQALVWPVLRVLDDRISDPRLAMIARHVGAESDDAHRRGRRYATARHVAGLFERYAFDRPDMLTAWACGPDTHGLDSDGAGSVLAEDMAWQPELWRAVAAEIGGPHPGALLDEVCSRLSEANAEVALPGGLPERINVFGTVRISEGLRRILEAIATHREVHVYVPHASPALWERSATAMTTAPLPNPCPRADWPRPEPVNPLLDALARDSGELQARLAGVVDEDRHHRRTRPERSTLLHALQASLRDDTVPEGSMEPDTSVEIHACHGPQRQIEVLRDRLLHLFSADPTLAPRDVLIMCPDIETFSPLIRGAFGQSGLSHPAERLRVRLADRGERQVNPVLDVVATVVDLAAGRAKAAAVLDLVAAEPVRVRFGFTDDDIETVREWLAQANIRWGIGEPERARFGMARFRQGTFDAGIDRIALGAVADEADGRWLGTALPLDAVESTAIDLLGRFDEFIDRLSQAMAQMQDPAPRRHWLTTLTTVVESLTASEVGQDWLPASAIRTLRRLFGAADVHGSRHPEAADAYDIERDSTTDLRLADVRDMLSSLATGHASRSNFRTGELTVCSMVPMRSVPHRVIVLLGVEADSFPRASRLDGDDILGRSPLVGERHPRDEDRQMFLDAVCAASDSLLVFYSGADPVTGRRIPPAVVVSELADAVTALTAGSEQTGSASATSEVIRRHTLHGFDARNFVPGAVQGIETSFAHDRQLLAGAQALLDPTGVGGARRPRPTPTNGVARRDVAAEDVELADLIAFHANPIEAFYRQRLGLWVPDVEAPHPDELDVELDPLDQWGIGDRFLGRMLAGVSLVDCQAAELRRGTLPPFAFGSRELDRISKAATEVYNAALPLVAGSGGSARAGATADASVNLDGRRRLHGTVSGIFDDTLVVTTYSKVRAKQRLSAWIRLLALGSSDLSGNTDQAAAVRSAVVVGRGQGRNGGVALTRLTMPEDPASILSTLVLLRDEGLAGPLPLPMECAAEFAEHHRRSRNVDAATEISRKSYSSRFGASTDRYVQMAFGGEIGAEVPFGDLLAEVTSQSSRIGPIELPSAPGEPVFGGLARLVWEPLLEHEVRS